MTLILTAMRGYPASGKSTRARELAADTGAVVVCRDDLRKMLHGVHFSGRSDFEDQVTVAERAQVTAFLKAGVSVIVDATHLEGRYLRKWAKLAAQHGAEFVRVDMGVDRDECIRRDVYRGSIGQRAVGPDVINRMADRNPINNWPNVLAPPVLDVKPVEWVGGLPEAIIVDIDGTLAHMNGERSPYDYSKVHLDTVDEQVRWLVNKMYDQVTVIVLSGRDDECRAVTEEWLWDNGVSYDYLFMRPTGAKDGNGNKLPDYMVKYDLFEQDVRGEYNVRFVLDDRNQVVDLWRRMGLKTLQVQEGGF